MDTGRLRRNLQEVEARIRRACARVGRDPEGVQLVVVTKSAPPEVFPVLAQLAITDVGEHRAIEGLERVGERSEFRRHMVGRLQTNKVKKVLAWAQVLHSVDRESLIGELARHPRRLSGYVQINVAGEAAKAGFPPEEAEAAVAAARRAVDVIGLMAMAPAGGPAWPHFRKVRELAAACGLTGLSMGMSGDFEEALQEGSTCLRLGGAIFEGVFGYN